MSSFVAQILRAMGPEQLPAADSWVLEDLSEKMKGKKTPEEEMEQSFSDMRFFISVIQIFMFCFGVIGIKKSENKLENAGENRLCAHDDSFLKAKTEG